MLNPCPVICNADLKTDLMSSFTQTDLTTVTDRTCNQAMLITDDAGLIDVADATSGDYLSVGTRTRIIASLSEVAERYAVSSETYKAASDFFANAQARGLASFFILAYWDFAGSESLATALDEINNCQPCFCHGTLVHFSSDGATQFMDSVFSDQLADWFQINGKMSYQDSIDELTEDPTNTTNLKARLNAGGYDCQTVNYMAARCQPALDASGAQEFFPNGTPVIDYLGNPVDDPDNPGTQLVSDGTVEIHEAGYPYEAFLIAGYVAGVDLSTRGSSYNMAYKPQGGQGWVGISPSGFDDSTVYAVTGQFPDGTTNPNNNGYANVYAQTAGYPVIFNGVTATGSYIDQCHLSKFLRRQIQDAVAAVFVQRRKIPYDDARGRAIIVNAVVRIMAAAQANGHFTNDPVNWEASGEYLRSGIGWVIRGENFADQSAARKGQRLAPRLSVCFVGASATNHVPIDLCTLAVAQSIAA